MTKVLGALLALFFLAWPITATAQTAVCGKRADLVKIAEEKYKERLIIRALTKRQSVVEIFSNEDGSSWTAFMTHSNGVTCVADAGDMLEILSPAYGQGS